MEEENAVGFCVKSGIEDWMSEISSSAVHAERNITKNKNPACNEADLKYDNFFRKYVPLNILVLIGARL